MKMISHSSNISSDRLSVGGLPRMTRQSYDSEMQIKSNREKVKVNTKLNKNSHGSEKKNNLIKITVGILIIF